MPVISSSIANALLMGAAGFVGVTRNAASTALAAPAKCAFRKRVNKSCVGIILCFWKSSSSSPALDQSQTLYRKCHDGKRQPRHKGVNRSVQKLKANIKQH